MLLQLPDLRVLQDLLYLNLLLSQGISDLIQRTLACNDILDSHSETGLMKPVVNQELSVREEVSARIGSLFFPYDVNHTA